MKRVRIGMGEHELNAMFRFLTYKNGRCKHQAYQCICAAGKNSATLHYPNSDKDVKDGSILLLDMGAEYHCYCSDITSYVITCILSHLCCRQLPCQRPLHAGSARHLQHRPGSQLGGDGRHEAWRFVA